MVESYEARASHFDVFKGNEYKDQEWFTAKKQEIEQKVKIMVDEEESLNEGEAEYVYFAVTMTIDSLRTFYLKQESDRGF